MSVEFEDQSDYQFKSRQVFGDYKKPGMVSWLEKKGVVKNEKTARYILFGVVIFCSALAFIIIFRNSIFSGPEPERLSEYQLQQLPEEIRKQVIESQNAR